MSMKLYPPNIEGTIPAFATSLDGTTTLVVPFSLNKAVSIEDISGFRVKIKTISGELIGVVDAINWDLENLMEAYFDLTPLITQQVIKLGLYKLGQRDNFQIGQYYKIQLAFLNGEKNYTKTADTSPAPGKDYYLYDNETGYYQKLQNLNSDFDPDINYYELDESDLIVGYYSTVGVTKYTIAPKVSIEQLSTNKINIHNYYYTGVYSQENGDVLEKLYSSRFKVYDNKKQLIVDSGEILHNTQLDDSDRNEQFETFNLTIDLDLSKNYFIQFITTSVNKMITSSPLYTIMQQKTVKPELEAELQAELNYENGYIELNLIGEMDKDNEEKRFTGAFVVLRNASNNPNTWDELFRFNLWSDKPSSFKWKDFTIEQGITYKYAISQFNDNGLYSNRIVSNSIYGDFEHAFLYDGSKQLKIKYNPKVSTFKNDILEQKIDTLGSKHPFIFRNGNVKYKEFSISGLISYLLDEEELFISKEDLQFKDSSQIYSGENIANERNFKLQVLEWLTDGKPKIFRSPTEGNYIIRLLNTSLSPNDQVGRLLHNFSATAYEIADFNYKNLRKLNIIKEKNYVNTISDSFFKVSLVDKTKTNYNYNNLIDGHQCYALSFTDVYPPILVNITILNEDNLQEKEEFLIGASNGTFEYKSDTPIISVKVKEKLLNVQELSGNLTAFYKAQAENTFSTYSNVTAFNLPFYQFIGSEYTKNNNIIHMLENAKTQFSQFYTLSIKRKQCTPIFIKDKFSLDTIFETALYQSQNYLPEEKMSLSGFVKTSDFEYNPEKTYYEKNLDGSYKIYEQKEDEEISVDNLYEISKNYLIPLEIYEIFENGITTDYFINGYDNQIFKRNPLMYNFIINDNEDGSSLNAIPEITTESPKEQQSFTGIPAEEIKTVRLYQGVYAEAQCQLINIDYVFEQEVDFKNSLNNLISHEDDIWNSENIEDDIYSFDAKIQGLESSFNAYYEKVNNKLKEYEYFEQKMNQLGDE